MTMTRIVNYTRSEVAEMDETALKKTLLVKKFYNLDSFL